MLARGATAKGLARSNQARVPTNTVVEICPIPIGRCNGWAGALDDIALGNQPHFEAMLTVVALIARAVLAVVFGVAGATKLADRRGSRAALEAFGVPGRVAAVGGVALPLCELVVAVGLLTPALAWWSAIGAFALLSVFAVAIAVSLVRGREPDCHCFGQLHSAPVDRGALVRNLILMVLSLVVVLAGPAEMTTPVGWLQRLSTIELVFGLVAVLFVAVALIQGFVLLQLLRQNGRVISRLERLEASRAGDPAIAPSGYGDPGGLPVGAPAPELDLQSLHGVRVSLADLRSAGRAVLLVFSDPDCGACATLLPHLAAWQREDPQQLAVALISSGGREQNAAYVEGHGIQEVLLQADREAAFAYRARVTPSAVLVSTDGRIASPLVVGPDAIRALKRRASAGSLGPEPIIERIGKSSAERAPRQPVTGLPIGTSAPELEWRDLDGELISLRRSQGKPVTLVFWDPRCGFCQRLAPELYAWQQAREEGDPQLIVISSGTPEENRVLALDCPVVTETGFETGAIFGIEGTPSGVAFDPEGKMVAPPALGGVALMDLLSSQVGSRVRS